MSGIINFDNKIAENTKKLRKKLGISVEETAEYLNVEGSFIRSVECFDRKYNLRHLYLIKDLINKYDKSVTFDDILPKRTDGLIRTLQKNTRLKNK